MSSKNHVRMKICGMEFVVCSDDSEQYIRDMGARVEQRIQSLMKDSASMSVSMAAVFTALELCDESFKAKEAADNLRVQIKEYLAEAARVRGENDELRRRVDSTSGQRQHHAGTEKK